MSTVAVEFSVRIDPPLPRSLYVDLTRQLGTRPLRRDAQGLYVTFPAPFDDLRIYGGETISGAKRRRLAVAIEYFDAAPEVARG